MAPNDKITAADSSTSRDRENQGKLLCIDCYHELDEDAHSSNAVDQNATSTNAQDHTLLKALQDLVIRVMNPKQTNGVSLFEYIQSQQNLSNDFFRYETDTLGTRGSNVDHCAAGIRFQRHSTISIRGSKYNDRSKLG
jgi:hypothetical protein